MRSCLTTVVGAAVLIMIVLVIASYTVVPAFLESRAAPVIQDQLALGSEPGVTLESTPGPNVYRGDFSGGEVNISDESFGGFSVRSVDVELDPFDVDVMRSVSERRAVMESEEITGDVRAAISGAELSRVAEASGVGEVSLDGDSLVVEQERELFPGLVIPVEARGGISLDGGNIVFTPDSVSAAGFDLPQSIVAAVTQSSRFSFPLDGIPPQMSLNDARIENGNLVLEGRFEFLVP